MKYRYIGLMGLLAILSVSVAGLAEAFLPGMPSLSGWSCAPAHKANCPVAGKLGYLGYSRTFVWGLEAQGQPLALLGVPGLSLQLNLPVEGVWASLSAGGTGSKRGFAACDPGEGLCFSARFSWLFPDNKEASETYVGAGVPVLARPWSGAIQWFTLEAAASRCAWSDFSLIGGFRWDSFGASATGPTLAPALGEAVGTFQLNSFIPYVGAETTWGAVKVGVIGFPWVFGSVVAGESDTGVAGAFFYATGTYRNGYFLETFAEFGRQMGAVHLSAYATYTVLHGSGDSTVQIPIVGLNSAPYGFSFDRQNWVVGGKLVVGLNTPL